MLTGPPATVPWVSNGPRKIDAAGETWEDGKAEISISPTNVAEVKQRVQADSMRKHIYMDGQAHMCSTAV